MKRKIKTVSHISVGEFFKEFGERLEMRLLNSNIGYDRLIQEPSVNRPGLALSGFISSFAYLRVQVLGNSDIQYINTLEPETVKERIRLICQEDVPCFVVSRDAEVRPELIQVCDELKISIFITPLITLRFMNDATFHLENYFAPSTTAHGCMLDFRGIGVLIKGKSGAGKSETAIGLIERGGALVADDHVKIRNVNGTLTTYTEDFSRGFIEMRGIGIINVTNLYGLGSIRPETQLDLIVNLRPYSDLNEVDRLGMTRETEDVLGVEVPFVDIPVAPGRDTARLVAVTALELQLRKLGYDMAEEFNSRLSEKLAGPSGGMTL
ncbi:HPr(Ser) kinase/phosphatase [Rubritalea marina]|uniref:HPr(Ser) kinase/phosphatase n=1 Tax=Rubritalea marina TaxID=361055 RepID=UPI00036A850B|nr:HPr(Ser) kinase/phosphatase [Rubritalea marina]